MSKGARLAGILVGALVVVGIVAGFEINYLAYYPPTVKAQATGKPGVYNLELQTVPSMGTGSHPTWVSYLVKSNGKWVHSTIFQIPANSLVHVTVKEYDTAGPLRNATWGLPRGLVGSEAVNGKPVAIVNPNSKTSSVAHTFTIPRLNVNVPLEGISPNTPSSQTCSVAPCTPNFKHNVITFSFRTNTVGNYHWQCFVPCGLGYLDGNGGPMATVGYMGGFIKVVA